VGVLGGLKTYLGGRIDHRRGGHDQLIRVVDLFPRPPEGGLQGSAVGMVKNREKEGRSSREGVGLNRDAAPG